MKTDYEKQASDFLKKTGTELKIEYLRTGKHFEDDKEERDIYKCTLDRSSRSYTFNFGQSLNDSEFVIVTRHFNRNELKDCFDKDGIFQPRLFSMKVYPLTPNEVENIKYPVPPTAYDILACMEKYDVGSFEGFCSEFGYDTDSRKAEKTYKAVLNEYQNLKMLFSDLELEEMAKIN